MVNQRIGDFFHLPALFQRDDSSSIRSANSSARPCLIDRVLPPRPSYSPDPDADWDLPPQGRHDESRGRTPPPPPQSAGRRMENTVAQPEPVSESQVRKALREIKEHRLEESDMVSSY